MSGLTDEEITLFTSHLPPGSEHRILTLAWNDGTMAQERLNSDPRLLDAVRQCRETNRYDTLRNWINCLFFHSYLWTNNDCISVNPLSKPSPRSTTILGSSPRSTTPDEDLVPAVLKRRVHVLRRFITKYLEKQDEFPIWSPNPGEPPVDQATADFIHNLKIPDIGGKPSLLLHGLGSFSQDPATQNRLNNIFQPHQDMCVSIPVFLIP